MSGFNRKKILKTYTGVSLELLYSFILELAFDLENEVLH